MPMSSYYRELRTKIGTDLIFSPSVAAVIRNDSGHILFVQSADDQRWSIPAGAIEIGEAPAQAIRREVWEETGLKVRPLTILGVAGGQEFRWTYADGNQVEYLVIVFECQIEGGKLDAIDGESMAFRYFDPSNLPPRQFPYPDEWFQSPGAHVTWFADPT